MSIKALLLDIGGVILEVDWKNSFEKLFPEAQNQKKIISQLSKWEIFHQFECGKISPNIFHHEMNKYFKQTHTYDEFQKGWNSCLRGPLSNVIPLFTKVNIPIYALSNTNKIHIEHFTQKWNFPFLKKIIASNELGHRKPSSQFFTCALRELNVDASQALFIDDLSENVKAAKSIGLHANKSVNSAQRTEEILKKYKLI